jgi:SNF2 family DNA or RNA helicase
MDLFKHQRESLKFIRERPRVFDASDPGTGKTRVAIESFAERRVRGGGKALVLAPKSLLRAAWDADIKKFAPSLRTSIAYAENRADAFDAFADIYVTNHDAAKWLAKQPAKFFDGFDTLIIDEVGAFKHATSQRSKSISKIKKFFTYRLVMNGTPTPNSITELWHQMFIIDDGARLGPSFFAFRNAVCIPKQVGPLATMMKWEDRPGAADAVAKLVEDVTIRHEFEKCIDIPENFEHAVPYYLTPTQMKVYDEMRKDQLAILDSMEMITAVNAAAVTTKLLQIASGAVYSSDEKYHLVDEARYELIMDLIEERQHCVVFFLWKHQREQLVKKALARGITHCIIDGSVSASVRNQDIDYYQKGLYKVAFIHPQSGAHGLTLTRGTSTIWASPTYNLEHYQQGIKRIYRAGQTQKTETIMVVAQNTLEDKVWLALQNKRIQMNELLKQL